MAIPRRWIAGQRLRISIPSQRIAIPSQRIAIPNRWIAIPKRRINFRCYRIAVPSAFAFIFQENVKFQRITPVTGLDALAYNRRVIRPD